MDKRNLVYTVNHKNGTITTMKNIKRILTHDKDFFVYVNEDGTSCYIARDTVATAYANPQEGIDIEKSHAMLADEYREFAAHPIKTAFKFLFNKKELRQPMLEIKS